jgi:hypothetical protein
MKADAEHRQRYLDGVGSLIEGCRSHHVRPIICSPAITNEAPEKAETGFLQQMTDAGLALAKSLGVETIDLQRPMRDIHRKVLDSTSREKDPEKATVLHLKDGVHLNELGHLAMAYAMLKGLGAPAEVSSVTLDAATGTVSDAQGCKVSEVMKTNDGISFTRFDDGLPLNLGPLSALNFRWVPIPDGINRYMLRIQHLEAGQYEVCVDGRCLGKLTAAQLAHGANISWLTPNGWEPGGPWDAQSNVVKLLVDAENNLESAASVRTRFLSTHPDRSALEKDAREAVDRLDALQHATAKPYPYHYLVRKIP